ncbi:MAG: ribonuclease HI [Myxococcales bacterium FL481]|nr:MAG: ribonuclease HI [Myxococcales bacterium FL481]
MPWRRYHFKDQEVFVRVLESGKPIVRRNLIELRYRLGATKSYRTSPDNVEAIDDEVLPDSEMGTTAGTAASTAALREAPQAPVTADTIVIYTDGACSGNPGPAGVGVYLQRPDKVIEIGEFIGSGTNNIAELTAILRALEVLDPDADAGASIHLYTDSAWSLGVLIGGWKAKANLELIAAIKDKMAAFSQLELLKVKGHAGVEGNEEADNLATMALRREDSLRRERPRRRSSSIDP